MWGQTACFAQGDVGPHIEATNRVMFSVGAHGSTMHCAHIRKGESLRQKRIFAFIWWLRGGAFWASQLIAVVCIDGGDNPAVTWTFVPAAEPHGSKALIHSPNAVDVEVLRWCPPDAQGPGRVCLH